MMSFGDRRVVVTGLGCVSPVGHGNATPFGNLCEGRSGVDFITRFDVSECPSKLGGIITDLEPSAIIKDRPGRRMLRVSDWIQTMALCAAELAVTDACLQPETVSPERLGVYMGVGRGGAKATQSMLETAFQIARSSESLNILHSAFGKAIAEQINPVDYLRQCPCLTSAYLSMRHNAQAPVLSNVNLCSAGAQSIGEAAWVIARGDADMMLAGGSDSMLNLFELTAFCSLDAVSGANDDGPAASKPFDLRRDGCVVGEGAAVLVLEELSHAETRGVQIYAELVGYGASSDAFKVSAPPDDGAGAVVAMCRALSHAGLEPTEIDHINAHGTSTPLNDRIETTAIKTVFGDHAYQIPVVSTKSMTGHLIAAAGALEALVSVMCIVEKRVPPTLNLRVRDPRCDLDYSHEGARDMPGLRTVMTNSFAIGGTNACTVFRAYEQRGGSHA